MNEPLPKIPSDLVKLLRQVSAATVLTGAGVSAESGVPTFRDAETGVWSQFKPEELATRDAFRHNPKMVWEWYAQRRAAAARVTPNAGHYALAEMERRVPRLTLITQNVDGLHRRAGSRNIVDLHGNIARVKCFKEDTVVDSWDEHEAPPRCPRCGSYLRPDVVWFGEMLPPGAMEKAFLAARTADVFFSIGTSGEVEPAASLPFEALDYGKVVVEINPDRTPLSRHATFRLAGRSGAVLPQLVQAVWGEGRV